MDCWIIHLHKTFVKWMNPLRFYVFFYQNITTTQKSIDNHPPFWHNCKILAVRFRREVNIMAHITVDDSENLEKAIKRFKRLVEKEGIIREYKKREYFEKPSTIKNRKNKTLQRKLMKKNRKSSGGRNAY